MAILFPMYLLHLTSLFCHHPQLLYLEKNFTTNTHNSLNLLNFTNSITLQVDLAFAKSFLNKINFKSLTLQPRLSLNLKSSFLAQPPVLKLQYEP